MDINNIDVVRAALLDRASLLAASDDLIVVQDGYVRLVNMAVFTTETIKSAPIFASEAAAAAGGLNSFQLYKTETGELRYKLPDNNAFTYTFPFNLS